MILHESYSVTLFFIMFDEELGFFFNLLEVLLFFVNSSMVEEPHQFGEESENHEASNIPLDESYGFKLVFHVACFLRQVKKNPPECLVKDTSTWDEFCKCYIFLNEAKPCSCMGILVLMKSFCGTCLATRRNLIQSVH